MFFYFNNEIKTMTKKCSWKQTSPKKQDKKLEEDNIKNEAENNIENKEAESKNLEEELKETKMVATKAQQDYIHLKIDFDHLRDRMEKVQKDWKLDAVIEVVGKFLPFVEALRKSIENIPDEQKQESLAKWVVMTYNNFLKVLEDLSIFPIEALWLEPDTNLHEPISVQPVEDESKKWKIIVEFEKWFVYQKDWIQKVIKSSKVIVWQ